MHFKVRVSKPVLILQFYTESLFPYSENLVSNPIDMICFVLEHNYTFLNEHTDTVTKRMLNTTWIFYSSTPIDILLVSLHDLLSTP